MPMRSSIRFSAATLVFRSGIACCTATAQRTASTTRANSTSMPSPVVLTMRPLCSAIFGSRSSRRSALRRSSVPSSSAPISREYPATSAARIAARRRVVITAASLLREHILQAFRQRRSGLGDGGPEDVSIDIKIGVDQPVSHSDDQTPRHIGYLRTGLGGYLAPGFACDLDGAHQREEQHLICVKIAAFAILGETDRRVQRIGEMLQPNPITRIHIVSRPRAALGLGNSDSDPRLCGDPPAVPKVRPTALARSLRDPKSSAWPRAQIRPTGRYHYPDASPPSVRSHRATNGGYVAGGTTTPGRRDRRIADSAFWSPVLANQGLHDPGGGVTSPTAKRSLPSSAMLQQASFRPQRDCHSFANPACADLPMRPWCSAIFGSRSSRRSALRRSSVPSSSAPISREYPATSAARIAARRRVVVMSLTQRSVCPQRLAEISRSTYSHESQMRLTPENSKTQDSGR